MNDNDRGMKKYMPYKSLNEQSSFLQRMRYEKGKKEKPPMFEEKAEAINEILVNYHGQRLLVRYHRDGYIHEEKGSLELLSGHDKMLCINGNDILFKELVDVLEI